MKIIESDEGSDVFNRINRCDKGITFRESARKAHKSAFRDKIMSGEECYHMFMSFVLVGNANLEGDKTVIYEPE